ncbi:hypothetical protein IV102_22010 [bacterium]|nr:hypothetical protein [bacterium]
MATIQPNFNPTSFPGQLAPSGGTTSAQLAAAISSANFGSIAAGMDQSQQMLQSLIQLQASWRAIGSGFMIGDGSTNSLGVALSGQYAGMTFGSPGNASDLNSLQAPLRRGYGVMSDEMNLLGGPLRGAYTGMMQIRGMPPPPPMMI